MQIRGHKLNQAITPSSNRKTLFYQGAKTGFYIGGFLGCLFCISLVLDMKREGQFYHSSDASRNIFFGGLGLAAIVGTWGAL